MEHVCTIVVATRVWPQWPLVIAANRDEALARPAEPPALRDVGGTRVLAPRDVEAGGTWLGLNAHGLFVGITNRFDPAWIGGRKAAGSRGDVVLAALQHRCAVDAADATAALDPGHQGPFHLVMADRVGAHVVWSDTRILHRRRLPPGVHSLTERSFDAAPTRREPTLATAVEGWGARPAPPDVEGLRQLLATHADDTLEGVCVHADDRGYGTRSSTLLRLGADGEVRMQHADGRPCTTPFRDLAAQVEALGGA